MLHFDLASLEELAVEDRVPIYASAVELLVDSDLAYLRVHEDTPALYASEVRYDAVAEWRDVPAAMRKRAGDCKTLAAWRIAELRQRGENAARVHLVVYPRAGIGTERSSTKTT